MAPMQNSKFKNANPKCPIQIENFRMPNATRIQNQKWQSAKSQIIINQKRIFPQDVLTNDLFSTTVSQYIIIILKLI